ncbi:uncharacterized protein KY384_007693 [Bacidia gigantensis]|uniref:uncharacterized protein n=1 Tax=Bacidia gigantensis TaxID=2732470 RepID=UPI001D05B650|nr:uncharacterized protein KY384_007693 [Bacidia gigantensis]KAG8527541.1 hypothetical protein KY384_007693 [Bacidia gigantensis]
MSHTLPLLPLPQGSVLLPGITLRIPVSGRSDIPALLSAISSKDKRPKQDARNRTVGCVPITSPLLRADGFPLPENDLDETRASQIGDVANPSQIDHRRLFMYGTVAKIMGVQGKGADDLALIVEGARRFRIDRFVQMRPYFAAEIAYIDEEHETKEIEGDGQQTNAMAFDKLKDLSLELLGLIRMTTLFPGSPTALSPFLTRRLELFVIRKEIHDAGVLADFMANVVDASLEDRLRVLASIVVRERMELMIELLTSQVESMKANNKIIITTTKLSPRNSEPNDTNQRDKEALLRKFFSGLGGFNPASLASPGPGDAGAGDEPNEVEELKTKIEKAKLSPEALKVAERELKRLKKMNPAQAEYGVCRTYIETLSEIPWTLGTRDKLGPDTLAIARKQLDDDHYGLQKIKKRLLEYLAVLRLKQAVNDEIDAQLGKAKAESLPTESNGDISSVQVDQYPADVQILLSRRRVDKSPILLLVGPPGTGKTSLAKSIATALGRKFHRISLGGVRDEAEIRGHRRTYVAAMPGMIVSGLRKVGVNNPVFLLDEIDKIGGGSFHGDPSAAMLEVLDPEQNHTFNDHYVNVPLDLSKVLFIATANTLDTIPAPLLDRMETISLSGYTTIEKRHIAKQHLIPRQIILNGLNSEQVHLPDDVVDAIITQYTRESGVRNLERELGSVCRYKAVEFSDAKDTSSFQNYDPTVSTLDLEEILGIERFDDEIAEKRSVPGIVTGLVAYSTGGQGSILFIEVADMPGSGRVQLTGKLGEVLKESVEVALTWVKAHALQLGLTDDASEDIMHNRSIHVHCPSGGIPKDGPSAGLSHAIALISLFSGRSVPPEIAMTGEISLRGRVMPVGGIKEKLIGAMRAGVKTVLLPNLNRKDLKDIPQEVKDGLEIIHVERIWEAMRLIWPDAHWPGEQPIPAIESRL